MVDASSVDLADASELTAAAIDGGVTAVHLRPDSSTEAAGTLVRRWQLHKYL